ncbi:hypothetical protein Tco_0535850 [Tanacetum coccineum]
MGMLGSLFAERTRHKKQYDRRMNERQMQSRESKVVLSKALYASLVVTECSGTKSDEHITSSSSGTYITHAVDADIRPVNDQVPFALIAIGQRFSPKKSSAVHEKPNTSRSCLRWKPTGRIFKIAGLRWIPTGKMFTDNTTKVDSEPSNGSNDDITKLFHLLECESISECQCSSGLALHRQMTSVHISSGLALHRQMTSVHISSGLALQRQMASADNTSGPIP